MARKTKKVLTDDQKYSRMEAWAKRLGFPEDTAKRMTEKYGMFGYDLMLKAMMEPANLKFPGYTSSKNALHYLLGEDKSGKSAPENNVTLQDVAKLLNKDVATIEAGIAEFRTADDIPTPLPTPPEAARQAERAQTRVERRVDAAMPAQPAIERGADAEMAPGEAQWIEQELARMKGSRGGELSFSTLRRNGLTNEDMQNALTPDMVKDVHAGPTSQRLAKNARRRERQMSGSGKCLAGVQLAVGDSIPGFCYGNYDVQKLPGCSSNSACFSNQAWEQCGQFTVFKFKNDRQNGNACLNGNPPLAAGAMVNFERGRTKHGHVTISDGNGGYDCDIHQSGARIASGIRADGTPYGDNYYISFTNDCTVSDELARQMLHERYLREHPEAERQLPRRSNNTMRVTPEQSDSIGNVNSPIIDIILKNGAFDR